MNNPQLLSKYERHDDEIDLKELFTAIWKGKLIIIFTTFTFLICGILYALSQPNIYKADVVLAYASGDQSGGLSALSSQFGGLASLAGVSLQGGGINDKAIALAILQSRQFINVFINKYNLSVPLMAGEKWDSNENKLILNDAIYDENKQKWLRKVEIGQSPKPTDWQNYKEFKEIITISESKETGLTTLSITHLSPTIAKQWLNLLVVDLNAWMKTKALDETRRNIHYLEEQIKKTNIADMQTVFYQLIESQTKDLMLAEVQSEFAFKVIDPAVVPEETAGPQRVLICVISILLGGMLGTFIVLLRFASRREK